MKPCLLVIETCVCLRSSFPFDRSRNGFLEGTACTQKANPSSHDFIHPPASGTWSQVPEYPVRSNVNYPITDYPSTDPGCQVPTRSSYFPCRDRYRYHEVVPKGPTSSYPDPAPKKRRSKDSCTEVNVTVIMT